MLFSFMFVLVYIVCGMVTIGVAAALGDEELDTSDPFLIMLAIALWPLAFCVVGVMIINHYAKKHLNKE